MSNSIRLGVISITGDFREHNEDNYLADTDGVDDNTLATLLHQNDEPQQAAEAIVHAAQSGGSKDNITCLVLHVI